MFARVGIRARLLDSEDHECPLCHNKDVSPDTLLPNRFLRTSVTNFRNKTGYTKAAPPQPTPADAALAAPAADAAVEVKEELDTKEAIEQEKDEPELILEVFLITSYSFINQFIHKC